MKAIIVLIAITILIGCSLPKPLSLSGKIIYKTDKLVITQIAPNSYLHTSYKQTQDFGYVPCNGLVVKNTNETIVFDTPTNDSASEELISWIKQTLQCDINAVIPTHFHDDCLGGLRAFNKNRIKSFAHITTIDLARANNVLAPQNAFSDSLQLPLGNSFITAKFFGEGHTKDNVVGYFIDDEIMFGGCLIKELNASKGYLGDANVETWSSTVENVKAAYPNVKFVVPGHGSYGSSKLLEYTIKLFKN